MKIAQGETFGYDVTVVGQNWTGYTGTATFKRAPQAPARRYWWWDQQNEPIVTVTATGDAAGLIQFGMTAAQTALLPALPRLGYFRQAVCEIAMTNASTGDVQRFQARVSVAGQI
jgi:hypothetical protein